MQEMGRKTVTLVLGGVRSGKSRWALERAAKAERVAYVATAQPLDPEMVEKVRRHREERPSHWHTFEEPLELGRVIAEHAAAFDVMLIDCMTIFVANLQGAANADSIFAARRIEDFLRALRTPQSSVVLVSNEVGSGVVPPYPAGRKFRDALGELNQRVAAVADNVVLLVAGIPLVLKETIGARS
ncbi:MAG TPA: bifunctional adenosylcobinamide kinase/adenosylcobinamide-phosphate guanylyltransferase [Terracidiphilus sp.]|nr:bifunctional adenosylcobinamide kinase/adenosylcobinamide-phosphate guanylyltransferase [Terracidiphilus sp.]